MKNYNLFKKLISFMLVFVIIFSNFTLFPRGAYAKDIEEEALVESDEKDIGEDENLVEALDLEDEREGKEDLAGTKELDEEIDQKLDKSEEEGQEDFTYEVKDLDLEDEGLEESKEPSSKSLLDEDLEEPNSKSLINEENRGLARKGKREVASEEGLLKALKDSDINHIIITDDIKFTSGSEDRVIDRPLTIEGKEGKPSLIVKDGKRHFNIELSGHKNENEVVFKNLVFKNETERKDVWSNEKVGKGGGIEGKPNGTNIIVDSCDFINNFTHDHGGAIFSGGSITVKGDSSFKGNIVKFEEKFDIYNNGGALAVIANEEGEDKGGRISLSGNVTFEGNRASVGGGALYIENGKLEIFKNSSDDKGPEFKNNEAGTGGAIYAKGASLNIEGGIFKKNEVEAIIYGGTGGVIYASDSNIDIEGGTFKENNAETGGVIYASDSNIDIEKSRFESNKAGKSNKEGTDGIIEVSNYGPNLKINISGSEFIGNTIEEGGVVYASNNGYGIDLDISGSAFIDNKGTGVYAKNSKITRIDNSQFIGNSSGICLDNIRGKKNKKVALLNNLFERNTDRDIHIKNDILRKNKLDLTIEKSSFIASPNNVYIEEYSHGGGTGGPAGYMDYNPKNRLLTSLALPKLMPNYLQDIEEKGKVGISFKDVKLENFKEFISFQREGESNISYDIKVDKSAFKNEDAPKLISFKDNHSIDFINFLVNKTYFDLGDLSLVEREESKEEEKLNLNFYNNTLSGKNIDFSNTKGNIIHNTFKKDGAIIFDEDNISLNNIVIGSSLKLGEESKTIKDNSNEDIIVRNMVANIKNQGLIKEDLKEVFEDQIGHGKDVKRKYFSPNNLKKLIEFGKYEDIEDIEDIDQLKTDILGVKRGELVTAGAVEGEVKKPDPKPEPEEKPEPEKKPDRPSTGGGGGSKPKPDPKPEEKPEEKPSEIRPEKPSTPEEEDKVNNYKNGDRTHRDELIGYIIEEKIDYDLNKTDHLAYLKGYPDKTVRPEGNVTREEAAMVFYRLMEPEFRQEVETRDHNFTDVEVGRWSEKAIATLAKGGMITGYKDGSFKARQKITRAEVSSMIAKLTDTIILPTDFDDIIEHWAEDYINSVEREGWIQGYEDGSFRPNDLIRRSEFATMVNSILERQVKKENILEGIKIFKDLEENKWYYEQMVEATNGHKYIMENGIEVWTELDNRDFE